MHRVASPSVVCCVAGARVPDWKSPALGFRRRDGVQLNIERVGRWTCAVFVPYALSLLIFDERTVPVDNGLSFS